MGRTDVDGAAVREIEARIDADYAAAFPARSFQEGAFYLLLAYEWFSREGMRATGQKFDLIDLGKFALMHAFNWARQRPQNPDFGLPVHPDGERADRGLGALQRGFDYTGVYVTFSGYSRGTMRVRRLRQEGIEFVPAAAEGPDTVGRAHFDMLDRQIYADADPADFTNVARAVNAVASAVRLGTISGRPHGGQLYLRVHPERGMEIAKAVGSARDNRHHELLPDEWRFHGLSIGEFRLFWDALFIVVHANLALTLPRQPKGGYPSESVIAWSRSAWELLFCQLSGLPRSAVAAILTLHTFEPAFPQADIALTPFVDLGAGILALSPNLVSGSAVERNFYAHVARRHKGDTDSASAPLAPTMGRQLADAFAAAGFLVATGVAVRTTSGSTDIDLLAWSPSEGRLLACELKWFIRTADFKEVLAKEKLCVDAIERQLPLYARALAEDGQGILARAFPGTPTPPIVDFACCLLLRGFVGGASVPRERFATIPEPLLRQQLLRRPTLGYLIGWVRAMPFIPRAGADFTLREHQIDTPSGIRIVAPSHEPGPPDPGPRRRRR